ncbi:MAG: Trk system potassium transporter TrkA, partial [Bacteroides graminisolvens]|nr:Trk system potassium transporter TrkA [Bacteroides graminisolvens]
MKIIIAGAGAVGTHLAKLLSREKQDIILIDDDEEKLSALGSNFDLMTVCASPSSISGLKEVGASEADLFIAVTPDESRNMTACMIASNLGAKKTVARIDNYEYLLPKNKEFFQKLGVDSLIYPEMLAAKEIVSSMRMSWIRQWWEFCGGALILIGTKMRESAEILNISLQQLGSGNNPYHIVAIKRGNETIIPRGSDVIKLHDIVYFTTTRKYIPYIRKIAGKEDYADVRNVMIMGGGRIAVRTAQYVPDYMQVKIVEQDVNRCNRLTELLDDKVMIINGDGRDLDLLTEEGLKNTEAFVALTGNSETNILACLAAKRMGVSKTVAEVENIDYIGMAESLDIGTVINKKMIAAGHIYQMMLDADVSNVKSLTFANADVAEFTVKADSKITRHHVKDLGLPKGTTIGGLIRDG